jgi:hypothetical protein
MSHDSFLIGIKKNIVNSMNPTLIYISCLFAKISLVSDIKKYEVAIIGIINKTSKKSKWVNILLSN